MDIAIKCYTISSSWLDVPAFGPTYNTAVLNPSGAGIPSGEFR
jgi:hypothetical protein